MPKNITPRSEFRGVSFLDPIEKKLPEDLKRAADYIIEQTMANQDREWGEQGFDMDDQGVVWQDSSYYHHHLNIEELVTNIARQFPDIAFTLAQWTDNDPVGRNFLWDGSQWVEYDDPEVEEYIEEQLDSLQSDNVAPENCTYTPDEDDDEIRPF